MTTKSENEWAEAFKAHWDDESKPKPGPAPTIEIWCRAVIHGLRDFKKTGGK